MLQLMDTESVWKYSYFVILCLWRPAVLIAATPRAPGTLNFGAAVDSKKWAKWFPGIPGKDVCLD